MLITSIHFNEIPAEKFATFADACAAGETLNKTIVVSSTLAVEADLTVDRSLVIKPGGRLTIASGVTLTINGPFQAGLSQCFDGDGSVVFGGSSVSEVYPEWWGVFPGIKNVSVDTGLRKMNMAVAASGGGKIKFGAGTYYLRDLVIDYSNVTVEGVGTATILTNDQETWSASTHHGQFVSILGPITGLTGNSGVAWTSTSNIQSVVIRNMQVVWDNTGTPDPLMNTVGVGNVVNCTVENILCSGGGTNKAITVSSLFDNLITKNITIRDVITTNSNHGCFINSDTSATRTGCVFENIKVRNCEFYPVAGGTGTGQTLTTGITIQGINYIKGLSIYGNKIVGGANSIYINGATASGNHIDSKIMLLRNQLIDFTESAVYALCKDICIDKNVVDSILISKPSGSTKQMGGFVIAYSTYGCISSTISNNTFRNCYYNAVDDITISISPIEGSKHNILNNYFAYVSGNIPKRDVSYYTATTTLVGIVSLKSNKFYDRAGSVANTGTNYLVYDAGDNIGLQLATANTLQKGSSDPATAGLLHRFNTGDRFKKTSITVTSGRAHVGWFCRVGGAPGTWEQEWVSNVTW